LLRSGSLLPIGDLVQGPVLDDSSEVRFHGQPSAASVRVGGRRPLALAPQAPAFGGRRQAAKAHSIDVTEVPRRAAFDQGDHLGRQEIGEAVEEDVRLRCGARRLELSGPLSDLEAEDLLGSAHQLDRHYVAPGSHPHIAGGCESVLEHFDDAVSIRLRGEGGEAKLGCDGSA